MRQIIKQIGIFLGYEPDKPAKRTGKSGKASAIAGIFATCEWLITAFTVTLIFIVFFMQAYTIPTGSMADTLKGAHFRLRCEKCGYRYDYGFSPEAYGMPQNYAPRQNVPILAYNSRTGFTQNLPKCPCCGYYSTTAQDMPVIKGDRIFVAKCLYQFFEPKRWDSIVFKNPVEPRINYIKRLIGKPGERIEIIDGDIYVDGTIARKPPKVQNELWMPIYDNDFQPSDPHVRGYNGHKWSQPFVNAKNSDWNLNAKGPTVFSLDGSDDDMHTLIYDTSRGNDFKATYGYNDPKKFDSIMPICSDLMMCFYLLDNDFTGTVGTVLSKYGVKYFAKIDSSGRMEILMADGDGQSRVLETKQINVNKQKNKKFEFCNVDHSLIFKFGNEQLRHDFGTGADDMGDRNSGVLPEAMIFGSGKITIGHIGLFRDIHYINRETLYVNNQYVTGGPVRAGEGNPFTLGDNEFFACGDNSPNSFDSRLWDVAGRANGQNEYRTGIVPRDYLVGKAFFVYWPGAFKPNDKSRIQFIPYIGGMKRIYGGTE